MVSFQRQRNPQNNKNPNKVIWDIRHKGWDFLKLYSVSLGTVSPAGTFLRPNVLCYAQNFHGFKTPFFLTEISFSRFIFIDKYIKFKKIFHSLYEVWNVTSLILWKFPLFSTVKLKLGHIIFQFILRFKIGIFECGS